MHRIINLYFVISVFFIFLFIYFFPLRVIYGIHVRRKNVKNILWATNDGKRDRKGG